MVAKMVAERTGVLDSPIEQLGGAKLFGGRVESLARQVRVTAQQQKELLQLPGGQRRAVARVELVDLLRTEIRERQHHAHVERRLVGPVDQHVRISGGDEEQVELLPYRLGRGRAGRCAT